MKAITVLRRALSEEPDYKVLYEKAAQQYNELAELMAEQPAQQEPVGHLLMGPKQDFVTTSAAGELEINVWHPVYTSPPAQRKPLTDEQIDAAVKAWFENDIVAGRQPFAKRMRAAIEAAHSIKGST